MQRHSTRGKDVKNKPVGREQLHSVQPTREKRGAEKERRLLLKRYFVIVQKKQEMTSREYQTLLNKVLRYYP